jgi:hypothetical protein
VTAQKSEAASKMMLLSTFAAAASGTRFRSVFPTLDCVNHATTMSRSGASPGATGACYCGAVSVRIAGEPSGASFCHCTICRRLSGAPHMAIALAPVAQVVIDGKTIEQITSKNVLRYRCAHCHSPVAAVMAGRTAALPLGIFDFPGGAPDSWRPQHHMYYDSRVLDAHDDLPKYAGSTRGPLWEGGPSASGGIAFASRGE